MRYLWVCLFAYTGVATAHLNYGDVNKDGSGLWSYSLMGHKRTQFLGDTAKAADLLLPLGVDNPQQPDDIEKIREKRQKDSLPWNPGANSVYDFRENIRDHAAYTSFCLGPNPSDNAILNAFMHANNLEYARGFLRVYSRDRYFQANIGPIDSLHNSRFTGFVTVRYNVQNCPQPPPRIPVRHLDSTDANLGVFRDLRGGITNNRLINRFIEVNSLPLELAQWLIVENHGNNDVKFAVRDRGEFGVILNGTRYVGTKRCHYTFHDELKKK